MELASRDAEPAAKHDLLVNAGRAAVFGLDPVVAGVVGDGDDLLAECEVGPHFSCARIALVKLRVRGPKSLTRGEKVGRGSTGTFSTCPLPSPAQNSARSPRIRSVEVAIWRRW